MQIEALETFLKISELGNFNRAAEALFVTPSTVSARIQTLEASLGQRLLNRSRSAVTLTQEGVIFKPYAQAVVRNWIMARRDITLPKGFTGIITIAAVPTIWHDIMRDGMTRFMSLQLPVAMKAVITDPVEALACLDNTMADIACCYDPTLKPGWKSVPLVTEDIILVATSPRGLMRWDPKYVHIDWGARFQDAVFREFPHDETPIMSFNDGSVALDYILTVGGSAYLPRRWVDERAGQLHPVEAAPVLHATAYAVYAPELLQLGNRLEPVEQFIDAIASGYSKTAS